MGYVPFTRECLSNKYIRHELGETGKGANTTLKFLVDRYEEGKEKLQHNGYKVEGIFDAEIPTTTTRRRKEKEDEQVSQLVARRTAFLPSGIFQGIRTMCVTSSAVLRAQRTQLENNQRKLLGKEEKKEAAKNKLLVSAQLANEKRLRGEKLVVKDLKAALAFILHAKECNGVISSFKTKATMEVKLNSFEQAWWNYIPDRDEHQDAPAQEQAIGQLYTEIQQLQDTHQLYNIAADGNPSTDVTNVAPVAL